MIHHYEMSLDQRGHSEHLEWTEGSKNGIDPRTTAARSASPLSPTNFSAFHSDTHHTPETRGSNIHLSFSNWTRSSQGHNIDPDLGFSIADSGLYVTQNGFGPEHTAYAVEQDAATSQAPGIMDQNSSYSQHDLPTANSNSFQSHISREHGIDTSHLHNGFEDPEKNFLSAIDAAHRRHPHYSPANDAKQSRFCAFLDAQTAMVECPDEVPVTYLNKGSNYKMCFRDTKPHLAPPGNPTYYTFIWLCFDDEKGRGNSSDLWDLWSQKHGKSKPNERAIEFVGPGQRQRNGRQAEVNLWNGMREGFVVQWTAPREQYPECSILMRFNFTSTEFPRTRMGNQGTPLRLCLATSMVGPADPAFKPFDKSEVSYCKIQVFRRAERKHQKDRERAEKFIRECKQQIEQSDSGVNSFGKRSLSDVDAGDSDDSHGGKMARIDAFSAISRNGASSDSARDSLQQMIRVHESMLKSQKEQSDLIHRVRDYSGFTPIFGSLQSKGKESKNGEMPRLESQQTLRSYHGGWDEHQTMSPYESSYDDSNSAHLIFPTSPNSSLHRTASIDHGSSSLDPYMRGRVAGYHDHVGTSSSGDGIDDNLEWRDGPTGNRGYSAKIEREIKPAACFLIQRDTHYAPRSERRLRKIYLLERTLHDFVKAVATRCSLSPGSIHKTLMVNAWGTVYEIDDQTIFHMPENQKIAVDFKHASNEPYGRMPGAFHGRTLPSQNAGYVLILRY